MINNLKDTTDKVLIYFSKDNIEITLKKYYNNSTFLYVIYSTSVIRYNDDLELKDETFFNDYIDAIESFENLQIKNYERIYLKILGVY